MYRLSNLKASLSADLKRPDLLAAKALGIDAQRLKGALLSKKSVDARDKGDVHFVLSIDFPWPDGAAAPKPPRGVNLSPVKRVPFDLPRFAGPEKRVIVVGLGPAGLFCALTLAQAGLSPIVFERGRPVDERARDVEAFFAGGALCPDSNIQFGEGGAGAFSDGKLNSGISDPRCFHVLRTLYEHGAPEEILYQARPHVGTDRLPGAVKSIREEIVRLGGTVFFGAKVVDLAVEDGRLVGAVVEDAQGARRTVAADALALAVGHSARDTFEALYRRGVHMTQKPFSIGARIEHPQKAINRAQYGAFCTHPALDAADYRLSARLKDGRGAYTFCMCPGGTVVASASEAGGVVTNGMSPFARDGVNANSALLVSVDPCDFGGDHPLAGVSFQRRWEKLAFDMGGGDYRAPAQAVGDFLKGQASGKPGAVRPSYRPGVTYTDLSKCLPDFAVRGMREGLLIMDRQLKGFADPGAVLTGVETRSSSPVRIERGDDFMSTSLPGLYPCGEGAGYAGGILSSAVDGIKCAQQILGGAAHD